MPTQKLDVKYNKAATCWVVDILDQDGNPILMGVPLVTGCDLLEQFAYLGFGLQMIAQTDFDTDAVPTFENLGREGHLYLLTP